MTRTSKKIGIPEDLVGVEGDGDGADSTATTAAVVGLGFYVGIFSLAGEMMGSIYRSLKSATEQVS
jgi:hypothetical protein